MFDPAGLVAFQLPKSLASRALEWPIAAALGYVLVAYGWRVIPRSPLHVPVAAVAATWLASALFGADQYLAVFGDAENHMGLTHLVDMIVLYLALAVAVRTGRDAAVVLGGIVSGGMVAIAYGAVQALGLDPFVWADDPRIRPFATLGNPDHFGHLLSIQFGVLFGIAIGSSAFRSRALALAGCATTIAMAAVVATRGTLLGLGAAVAVGLVTLRPDRRAALATLAAASGLAVAIALTPLGQRTLTQGAEDRPVLYEIALRATLARPILGYGPDSFRVAFPRHRAEVAAQVSGVARPESTAHDWILDASSTTGIAGLAALLAVVLVGTVELSRLAARHRAIGGAFLAGWAAYWAHGLVTAASLAAAWYPWAAIGVAVALRGEHVARPTPRRIPRLAVIAIAIGAIVGAATGARAFQADRDAWSSEEAAHFGDLSAATTFADRAAARDGGRADNWNRLGLRLEAEGRLRPAVDAYREAVRRAPYEAVYWADLALALQRVAEGDSAIRDAAMDAARNAAMVDPGGPIGHVVLAEVAIAQGKCDIARAEAMRATQLQTGYDELKAKADACR